MRQNQLKLGKLGGLLFILKRLKIKAHEFEWKSELWDDQMCHTNNKRCIMLFKSAYSLPVSRCELLLNCELLNGLLIQSVLGLHMNYIIMYNDGQIERYSY